MSDDVLDLFPPGTHTDGDGTLVVGGCRLDDLAAEFGTPVLVVDEGALRSRPASICTSSAAADRDPTWPSRRSPSPAPPFSD
jgi:hypothetical protein